jgi:DNA-binding transcriptional MerR regulator
MAMQTGRAGRAGQARQSGQARNSGSSSQNDALAAAEIPNKLYFRIGDVAKICAVEPYVLRFWETQFPALKPNKGGTGQRLYRRREVELALRIKQLVHQEGYTLAGARQALESAPRIKAKPIVETAPASGAMGLGRQADESQRRLDSASATIGQVRAELRELVRQLGQEQPLMQRRRSRLTSFKPSVESLFDPLFPS